MNILKAGYQVHPRHLLAKKPAQMHDDKRHRTF